MPTYIVLGHFTDQGIRAVRPAGRGPASMPSGTVWPHAHRFSMMAEANSEVLRTRAPSIWRSKS